ncbi:kinase non-catalytic C-lobe domain-containing protein 1 [Aplochiton taeniatus]
MGTPETDALVAYSSNHEEDEEEYYESEHLPPLLEDEENVSLADILALRDICLDEEEVWAVCVECVLALQSIGPSALFHTLCITPDTLAFNALGNVCFMEQLSDDPDGSFAPPEFDSTGSTLEGHVYSLGATISAALDFVIEPELEAELGEETQRLLERMQEEKPEDRLRPQDILSLAEAKLNHTSSFSVCRKLSSVGRRVLSIESVSAIQDGSECCWEARWQQRKLRSPLRKPSAEEGPVEPCSGPASQGENGLSRQHVCGVWDPSLWAEAMDDGDGAGLILGEGVDARSPASPPLPRGAQERLGRARGFLNRSCSVPDSNNPPSLPASPRGDISVPVSDLTEIGAEDPAGGECTWSRRLQRLERSMSSSEPSRSQEAVSAGPGRGTPGGSEGPGEPGRSPSAGGPDPPAGGTGESRDTAPDPDASEAGPDPGVEPDPSCDAAWPRHGLAKNHMTKSMLCLNEETQDEWISLRELLTRCGRRLAVNELWALCHVCLSTLQTYIDYPAYLCLDTVYVGCEGEVLFLKPKNTGSCDAFYLAPEFQEHGIVTEKACVYGVAAILWAAAKFSLSPHQKLAMPRKLKRLLLEMAKRTPIERPSIAIATKVFNRPLFIPIDFEDQDTLNSRRSSSEEFAPLNSVGFVPVATESQLAPVPGPVPHRKLQLPEAFTSPATHFTPIILTQDVDSEERTTPLDANAEGVMDGFLISRHNQHMSEKDLDTIPHLEDPPLPQSECHLLGDEWNFSVHQRTVVPSISSSSTTSSGRTLVHSPPASPQVSNQGPAVPPSHSSLCSHPIGVVSNYLLRQDPRTGHLTLVPVQIAASESVPGLCLNLPRLPDSHPGGLEGVCVDCLTGPVSPADPLVPGQEAGPPLDGPRGVPPDPPAPPGREAEPGSRGGEVESLPPLSGRVHPALREVIDLLLGEFAFQGDLEMGDEDLVMGEGREYIFSLKDLQYRTFTSVVKEKFSDLYWEEDLLGVLHCLVNCSHSALDSNEQPSSKLHQRAEPSSPLTSGWGRGREPTRPGPLDLKGSAYAAGPSEGSQAHCEHTDVETATRRDYAVAFEESQPPVHQDPSGGAARAVGAGAMERGGHPAGGSDESPSEAPWEAVEVPGGGHGDQMSPECSEDMEDTDSLMSECLLSPGAGPEAGARLGLAPAWPLAFHGEDWFSPEVVQYTLNLGQRAEPSCVDLKAQELQQQLMMETRNLKKTRTFHQKLLNQERKNKGSDAKLMLSKLRIQLDELRSKVEFLESVKKYLEVLSVNRWGVEVSLLPALAAFGCDCLTLQPPEKLDPAVLSFGTGKGKSSLQSGSPLGLMAYLYARSAPLEGYIQQFLYTYRYFCTPEDLLRFLMEKFTSVTRGGPNMSEESTKLLHRSLDLLQAWLMDCRLVDFSPKSNLLSTLENFLKTEVLPVDSRGEELLAVLQSSTRKKRSQSWRSSLSLGEDDDVHSLNSMGRRSSVDDPGRKTFQWKISRVVEPQASLPKEKSFSIAAALPRPCYSSLMEDLSSACLRSEENQLFCQCERSAQHVAQQLTLLQQELFYGCHPVHFLNSRAQGVRDKAVGMNKNVSHNVPPAEGSNLFVCEVSQDSHLHQLLAHADTVCKWVSAETVSCNSVKAQAALLTKFLLIAKYCYEWKNFATAMQVLGGLENVIVRQLPAWKHLSTKVCQVLEELRAVQVFLKSDNLCLMGGERGRRRATLPSAHILAMHLQQLEIGAFTLTSGAYKWTKLRNIAKVVSQVQAFQETVYPYSPDLELQAYLRLRISNLSSCDVHLLAADNDTNFPQATADRHTRRIQDTLRRVKATFQ